MSDMHTHSEEAVRQANSARLVWYASYGSNLSATRFATYIQGGRAHGAARAHAGARDATPPRDDVAISIDHRLYFSGHSTLWGGAAAFIDTVSITDEDAQRSLGRAYLISWAQFEDVVAEENGRPTAPIAIADAELVGGFSRVIGPGRYENLLCLGRRGDVPVVTFTAPWTMDALHSAAPSRAYLAMLAEGLREAHGLADFEILTYLGGAPGCRRPLVQHALELLSTRATELPTERKSD